MGNRIVLELGRGKELRPLVRVIGTEDMEVSFYFLVGWFGLSVGLRIIGSGKTNIVFKESGEFFGECRGGLWSSVRDESIVKSEAFERDRKRVGQYCSHQ